MATKTARLAFAIMLSTMSFGLNAQTEISLDEISVIASAKDNKPVSEQPVASTLLGLTQIERRQITEIKNVSAYIPNFYIPDYGSKMTSSIYIRGLGARIDQPVMGMNVDNVAYLNKNNFDFDLFDLSRIEVLRGPQGTLYGRNTMCGLMNVYTLSPLNYQGTRLAIDYGSGNELHAKASTYFMVNSKFGFSAATDFKHSDGLFTNTFNNSLCDKYNGGGLRLRAILVPISNLTIDNSINISLLKQGGYAYAQYNDSLKRKLPICYNDTCQYYRTSVIDGLHIKFSTNSFSLSHIISYQFLDDKMDLDQDFSPKNLFTMTQKQKEHAVTQDIIIKSNNDSNWKWQFGLWGFYKHNNMSAPVTFKRDGIDQLILANANKGIQTVFQNDSLNIAESEFIITSNFILPTIGTAIYHQSEVELGKFTLTAGLRFDYEHSQMKYNNYALLNYIFTVTMKNYKPLVTRMEGKEKLTFAELLPKLALQYSINSKNNLYAYVAKGYKAGGFNTQIFSDILQNKIKTDMMSNLGVHFDNENEVSYNSAKATSYKPEQSINYEIGGHFCASNINLSANVALFYIACHNQQLTVFPAGMSTGRMMTNAGQSRSMGTELDVKYSINNFNLALSYGHTNAKFVEYNNGNTDYSGNYVPFSPLNTTSATAQYTFYLSGKVVDQIAVEANWKGIGKIYWDESNSVCQPFYSLIGTSVAVSRKNTELNIWCRNLSDCNYDTFYFMSVGNKFFQSGKPRTFGVSIKYNIN